MMKRKIKYIAIHCTGASQSQTVESILAYWKNKLGWKDPGYHRIIEANGRIHNLLPFDRISNGVKGFNSQTINICYIGGKDGDDRTEAQKASLLTCIYEALYWANRLAGLTELEKIRVLQVRPDQIIIQGHRDFPNVAKACPNFDAKTEYNWI